MTTKYYLFDNHVAAGMAPLIEVREYDEVTRLVDVGDHQFIRIPDILKIPYEPIYASELLALKNQAIKDLLGLANCLTVDGWQGPVSNNVQLGIRNSSALRPPLAGYAYAYSSTWNLGLTPTMYRSYFESFRYYYGEDQTQPWSAGRVTRMVRELTDAELLEQVTALSGSFNGAWTNYVGLEVGALSDVGPISTINQGSTFTLRARIWPRTVSGQMIISPIYVGNWALAYE
jgi:hypothetical protein